MSFADYTALKTTIQTDWLKRTDITTLSTDFIQLFESDFNSSMRVRQMEQQTATISTDGYLLHPTNWLGWKEVRGTSGGVAYHLTPASDEIIRLRTAGAVAPARYYKVKGTKTYVYPAVNAVTFPTTYYEGVALTSGTNWLLTAYPGAYLYGSLLQATGLVGLDPRAPLWQAAYSAILDRIKADSRRSEWSGQVLRMNPDIEVR